MLWSCFIKPRTNCSRDWEIRPEVFNYQTKGGLAEPVLSGGTLHGSKSWSNSNCHITNQRHERPLCFIHKNCHIFLLRSNRRTRQPPPTQEMAFGRVWVFKEIHVKKFVKPYKALILMYLNSYRIKKNMDVCNLTLIFKNLETQPPSDTCLIQTTEIYIIKTNISVYDVLIIFRLICVMHLTWSVTCVGNIWHFNEKYKYFDIHFPIFENSQVLLSWSSQDNFLKDWSNLNYI